MALPRYHTCASLPTCRIYVHPFRNSFGLIELCRLSQDTRLTSDSCSSGWSFVIGFLHQGRCLPRLARLTRPSPVRADSGLSPHRHTCAAGRTNKNPGLFRNRGSWNGEPDDVLLSLEIQPPIIGDKVFHCPVRNGKEWDHLSMVIRQRLCCASSEFFTWSETKLSCDSLTQKFS